MKRTTIVDDSSDEEYQKRKSDFKPKKHPTAYNKFIGEQIQRMKLENPEISARDRMITAQQLWRERK